LMKAALTPTFSPAEVAKRGNMIDSLVEKYLDRIASKKETELITEVANPFSCEVIMRTLGFTPEETEQQRVRVRVASDQIGLFLSFAAGYELKGEAGAKVLYEVAASLIARYRELLKQPTTHPDVDTTLMRVLLTDPAIPPERLESNIVLFLHAGQESTARLIQITLGLLLHHPQQLALLRTNLSHYVPQAIEEALRFKPVFRYTGRHFERPGQPVSGLILVSLHQHNLDPKFGSDAKEFKIDRNPSASYATFGLGTHMCLGRHLARLEATRLLTGLFQRFPNLRLGAEEHVGRFKWDTSNKFSHGFLSLNIAV